MLLEASFIALLRTFLIIVLVYYAFKLLFRHLIPFLFKLFLKRYTKDFDTNTKNRKKEGEISIDTPSKSSVENDNLGEYVDFEEVEEKNKK